MIFLTVGTQLPFDRLTKAVDEWAIHNDNIPVMGQIGLTKYKPKKITYSLFISENTFKTSILNADVIVSHAGIGTLLTAMEYSKPIIVLPRLLKYGEHRNDHQLATANWLNGKKGVMVCSDEKDVLKLLDTRMQILPTNKIQPFASEHMINALRKLVFS